MEKKPSIEQVWKLPPLILHPFADSGGSNKLIASSRASLMLQGLLPREEFTEAELDASLLDGRFCEVRMLYYVGKDLFRWIEQCMEFVESEAVLRDSGIVVQSFTSFVMDDPPHAVHEKLNKWGVVDYKAIFKRAIALNLIFADAPEKDSLAHEFIRNYFRYADQIYAVHQGIRSYTKIRSQSFDFDLFASGEYARLLEREWQES